jgi:site-specific DNA-methyltransferase (adenine-specific)/adenine-specific DNA-methyltransferase
MPNLTDAQRQYLIELLERGEDLPLDYKHLLFPPERQEYELVYAGKEREEDVLAETMAVPLQSIRTFGSNGDGWHNMLIFGDNLQAMRTLLKKKEQGQLVNADGSRGMRLVYIDPPFATKQDFRGDQDERAYRDKIVGAEFIEFLRRRLVFLRELLTDDGAIFVHLDWKKGHYARVVLDEVFGEHNFRNEIVVRRTQKNYIERDYVSSLNVGFDTVYVYAKSSATRFRPVYKQEAVEEKWHALDAPNWSGTRPNLVYELFGQMPPPGRCWAWTRERAGEAISKGDLRPNPRTGRPEYRIPAREQTLCTNLWQDLPAYSFDTGYPTEKHEKLLSRIIEMASISGDLILDAFAGSGTTLAVAEKLGRRWIGIDCGKLAIYTIQKRMLNLKTEIGNRGRPLKPKPFTLYNAGLYDFSLLKQSSWEVWRFYALDLFQCQDKPHKVGGILLDGYRGGDDVLVFNHMLGGGVVLDYGYIDDLHAQIGSRVGARFFIIAPAASVTFLEDYVDKGRTRYYILRIPYSIINELHNRDFEAITQPVDETQVNQTVEAVGFDFIRQPKVECEYLICQREGQMLKDAVVKIKTFKSEAMAKGASQKGNLETLSMVLVGYNYPYDPTRKGKEPPPPFELDAVFYASDIQAADWEVRMPLESLGEHIMLIYLDIYGNEYTEIKTPADFSRAA